MSIVRELRTLDERLHRRLSVAVLSGVCALGIVSFHPSIHVRREFFNRVIQLAPEGTRVEVVLDRLMGALADAIRLRALGLRTRMLDALQIQVEARTRVSRDYRVSVNSASYLS